MTSDSIPVRRKRSFWARLRRFLLILAVLVAAGGAALVWLLSSGPVSVPLLASLLEYQGTRGPVTLEVGGVSVDATTPDGILMALTDSTLTIAGDSQVQVDLPRIEVPINSDGLLAGEILFSSLTLDRPKVKVALSGAPAAVPAMDQLIEAVDRVSDVVDDQFERRQLRFIKITNGAVETEGGLKRRFTKIDADISRNQEGTIRALAEVTGRISKWTLEYGRKAPGGGASKTVGVLVSGITPAELLGTSVSLKTGKGLRLPVSAKLEAELTSEGKFVSSNAVVKVSNGWFQFGKTLVAFDDAALSLVFAADTPAIRISRSHVLRGNNRIFFDGVLMPPEGEQPFWDLSIKSDHPIFGSSDIPEFPQILDTAVINLRIDPAGRRAIIDNMVARAGDAVARAKGSIHMGPDGPDLALALFGENVPVSLAKQLWPITVVPPARRWIIDHIKGGVVDEFLYTASIRAPAFNPQDPDPGWSGNDMQLDLSFSDGRLTPIGDVPEVAGIEGKVTIRDEILRVDGTNGRSLVPGGEVVAVPEGVFEIRDLSLEHGKLARVDVTLEGRNKDLGDVVDSAPFQVLERSGLSTDGVTGEGSVTIEASFELKDNIDLAELDWNADARSANFSDREPIMGHTIRNADVVMSASKEQVAITGRGVLDGLPANINLVLPLDGSEVDSRQDVILAVTAEQLKERDIDLTAFLEGPMVLNVENAGDGQLFTIDLEKTTVKLDVLGWQKSAGVPAISRFKLVENGNRREIRDFRLESDGVEVAGSARLAANGDLLSADFSRFHLRPGDDAEFSIERQRNGRYDIAMSGESFDGRGLIRAVRSPAPDDTEGAFDKGASIDARFDRIIGHGGVSMTGFKGVIETSGKDFETVALTGQINGREEFSFTIEGRGGSSFASGRFADTGATLKFLDLYERMEGGRGRLAVEMADSNIWVGNFHVKDLAILEDPAILQLRQQRELRNWQDREPGAPVSTYLAVENPGSASFDRLDIDFTRDANVLAIDRGSLRGAVLGGTVSGFVNLKTQILDLSGTFVPIYALNNLFAKIPILGFALGGGSGEGLFGVTYRLTGPVSDPNLSVNPVSAIAPGIFRKMFQHQPNQQ